MRQWRAKGFTLIELLIVVAIIAILAAIAVPNFLEAQVRAKVSRAKTDMRTIATGLEAYFVDNNTYAGSAAMGTLAVGSAAAPDGLTVNATLRQPATQPNILQNAPPSPGGAYYRITFQTHRPSQVSTVMGGYAFSLTTPVSYLTSFNADPFADTKGGNFGYFNAQDAGWILWSYGPDTDEGTATGNGQIQCQLWGAYMNQSVYNPYTSNPTLQLLTGVSVAPCAGLAFNYDTTNGSTSKGDVWRVKQ